MLKRRRLLRERPWLASATLYVDDLRDTRILAQADRSIFFERVAVVRCDFSGGRFGVFGADAPSGWFAARGTVFEGCDFSGVISEHGRLSENEQTVYRDCNFARAQLWMRLGKGNNFHVGPARFERCCFDGAIVKGWLAQDVELVGCRFRAARIDRCRFTARVNGHEALRPPRSRNAFSGNDFSGAIVNQASYVDEDGVEHPLAT